MRHVGRLGLAASILLATAAGCGGGAGGSRSLDGVYRMQSQYGDDPSDLDPVPENYGDWILVLDRGHFAFTQRYRDACTWGYGTFTLNGDEMDWTVGDGGGIAPTEAANKPGEYFRFRWSRYRDTLRLRAVTGTSRPEHEVSPANFRTKPWHLVGTRPSRRYFAKRCPPPERALP